MGCRLNYLSEINVLLGITLVWLVLHSQPEHRPLHQQILYSHNKRNQVTHLTCKTVGGNLRACQPILTLLVLMIIGKYNKEDDVVYEGAMITD